MGLSTVGPVEVRYGADAVVQSCPAGKDGCTDGMGEDTWLAAGNSLVFGHELVHALRRQHHLDGPRAIEEGLAQVLRGRPGVLSGSALLGESDAGPASLWPLPIPEFYAEDPIYVVSGVVMHWLSTEFGDAAVMAFVRNPAFEDGRPFTDVTAALEAELGETLETLDARWQADGAWNSLVGSHCESFVDFEGQAQWGGNLDCEGDDDTLEARPDEAGNPRSMSRLTCLRVPVAQRVRIEVEADGGWAEVAAPECVGGGPVMVVEAREPVEMELGACDWMVRFVAEGDGVGEWELTVTAAG
jgi:hypothetical protein